VLGVLSVLTGLVVWKPDSVLLAGVDDGRGSTTHRIWHFARDVGDLLFFVLGHLVMVILHEVE